MNGWLAAVVRGFIGLGIAMGAPCSPEIAHLLAPRPEPGPSPDWDAELARLIGTVSAADRAAVVSTVRGPRGKS